MLSAMYGTDLMYLLLLAENARLREAHIVNLKGHSRLLHQIGWERTWLMSSRKLGCSFATFEVTPFQDHEPRYQLNGTVDDPYIVEQPCSGTRYFHVLLELQNTPRGDQQSS